ncbi:TetR/AcrR family transcriptional regulator [Caulobacter soli]|uniref:TetR/AcrR family transcriptional regulator n=1 Tax=Caulobacter soli TaxID=2708539 RepID=UPI0013EC73E4|nr:TetR/AcrR family transcriptional regulator [Caulobacter soli]
MVRSANAIAGALLRLLEQKTFDQITVREICAEAKVHYATFFRHHPTKEALLDHVAADQIDQLVALSLPIQDSVDTEAAFIALCAYVDDHRVLWTALLNGGAGGAMREELLRIAKVLAVERSPTGHWLPVDLATVCTVTLIVETLSWWLGQPTGQVSIEQLAKILTRLITTTTALGSP